MPKKDEPANQPDPEPDDEPTLEPEPAADEIDLDKLIEDKIAAALEKVTGEPASPKAEPSPEPTPAPTATSSSSGTSSPADSDIERRVEKVLAERDLNKRVADLEAPKPPKERKGLAKILWG